MKSVAQMVSFFESSSKNVKKTQTYKSPPKLKMPTQFKQKIIMPAGGIPKYYGVPQRNKSPKLVRNVQPPKEPEKIDKQKIKENMDNMIALIEKKGLNKRPFRIEPSYSNSNEGYSHNKFMAAKNVFEPKNNNNMNKVYENKPMRKEVKKKAKIEFQG